MMFSLKSSGFSKAAWLPLATIAVAVLGSAISPAVAGAQVVSIEITDENFDPVPAVTIDPGDSMFVGVEAFDAAGNAIDPATLTFLWTSSNPGVVEIRPRDDFEVYFVGVGPGRAQVEISVNRFTQILQVTVQGEEPVLVAGADSVLPTETMSAALDNVVMVTATRLGSTSCQAGYLSDRSGLVVTSYTSIRGAEAIQLRSAGGGTSTSAMVAAYDVERDVAVLRAAEYGTFFGAADTVSPTPYVWQLGFPDCQSPADAALLGLDSVDLTTGTFVLSDSIDVSRIGGAVITRDGRLVGLANQVRGGINAANLNPYLDRAQAGADVVSVRTVAQRTRHLFGSVALSSSAVDASVRIEPTQANQWPELEQTVPLPFTFVGPQGNYRANLLIDGEVASTTFFQVRPGLAATETLTPTLAGRQQDRERVGQPAPGGEIEQSGGGGLPMPLLIVGAIGAGAAAFLLGGGGGKPDTTVTGGKTTGTITIFVPRP